VKRVLPIISLCVLLMHCNPDEPKNCLISECQNWSYAIVDWDTNENMVGYDRKFDPDKVTFLDEDQNKIFFNKRYSEWADWWEFSFNYHDLLQRCDLHNTDSTIIIRIFVQLDEQDTDTLDTHIAPCRDFDDMFYNGSNNFHTPTEPIGEGQLNPNGLSSFHLRKKLN